MLGMRELQRILEKARPTRRRFAELYLERTRHTGIVREAGKVERVESGAEVGAGVRVICDGKTAYGYTNDVSLKRLLELAGLVGDAAGRDGVEVDLRKAHPRVDFAVKLRPDEVAVEAKVEAVRRADEAARRVDPRVTQVRVTFADVVQQVTVANSAKVFAEDERIRTLLAVNAVATREGKAQTGYEAHGGFAGMEILQSVAPEELGESAARRAVLMLEAEPAPAGRMPVVMAGEAGGTMIHEACGHGLEADLVQRGVSVYAGRVGEQVAGEGVTVVDDATLPGKYGSFRFDDEGTPSRRNELIKDGVLQGYMYDRLTARKGRRPLTGNGRRQSYQHKPIPRMSNTFIAAGRNDPEEIIRQTQGGLFVRRMGGGEVNTANGDFVFHVSEAYLIEEGKCGQAVRGATLIGNGPQVLRVVDLVGNDVGFKVGFCGKDGQRAPVVTGQPTIRIPELTVGGVLPR